MDSQRSATRRGSAKPALARLWRGVFFSVSVKVAIIGGGIVGLATAHQLLERFPGVKVLVLEKESGPGRHQTGHNSGVLHCGLYYKPGIGEGADGRDGNSQNGRILRAARRAVRIVRQDGDRDGARGDSAAARAV